MNISKKFLQQSAGLAGVLIYVIFLGVPVGQSFSLYLLAIVALFLPFSRHDIQPKQALSIIYTLLALVTTTILSIIGSIDITRSFLICLSFFPAAIVFYIISNLFNTKHINLLFLTLTLMSVIINIVLLMSVRWNNSDDPVAWMLEGKLAYLSVPNDLIFVALIMPLTLSVATILSSWYLRIFCVISMVLCFIVIILFRSNAALLILFVSIALVVGLLWPARCLRILALCVVCILILDGLQNFLLLNKFLQADVWGNRLPLWISGIQMFLDAPFLGNGPGAFSLLSENYIKELALPEWTRRDPRHAPWTHNLYLEVLAERGVIGLISVITPLTVISLQLWKMRSISTNNIRIYAISLLASLFGILFAGTFELSLLRHWVVIMLAIISASTIVLIKYR